MTEKRNIQQIGNQIVLFAVFLFLFSPFLTSFLDIDTRPLDGAYFEEKDTTFNVRAWFDGGFQEQKEKHLERSFGMHNYLVRLNNQLDFALFNKAHARHVIIGKNNFLYETGHIDAYYGRDFVGEKKIRSELKKLKAAQDTMEKLGKLLLTVYAPGKASFYPEHIPDKLKGPESETNYGAFTKISKELGINHIDFNSYFVSQKNKSKYPLYPQFGVHWSNYGAVLAFDSLKKYMEAKLKIDMADVVINSIKFSDSLRAPDDDIIKGMNLMWDPPTYKMAYPDVTVRYDSVQHKKIKLLIVSDSFWWYIYSTELPEKTFSKTRFWYYNQEVYPESFSSPMAVLSTNYFKRIREADVIVIMNSESTLNKFGNDFVDMCYEAYCKPNYRRERIQKIKSDIRSTPKWYKEVVRKAHQHNVSIDSMLTIDATFTLKEYGQ